MDDKLRTERDRLFTLINERVGGITAAIGAGERKTRVKSGLETLLSLQEQIVVKNNKLVTKVGPQYAAECADYINNVIQIIEECKEGAQEYLITTQRSQRETSTTGQVNTSSVQSGVARSASKQDSTTSSAKRNELRIELAKQQHEQKRESERQEEELRVDHENRVAALKQGLEGKQLASEQELKTQQLESERDLQMKQLAVNNEIADMDRKREQVERQNKLQADAMSHQMQLYQEAEDESQRGSINVDVPPPNPTSDTRSWVRDQPFAGNPVQMVKLETAGGSAGHSASAGPTVAAPASDGGYAGHRENRDLAEVVPARAGSEQLLRRATSRGVAASSRYPDTCAEVQCTAHTPFDGGYFSKHTRRVSAFSGSGECTTTNAYSNTATVVSE
jgi:hypothetical protein